MSQPIHLCILTTAHPVDDVRVNHKFAASFLTAGFRVTWVGPSHDFFGSQSNAGSDITFLLGPPLRSRRDRLLSRFRIRAIARKVRDVNVFYAPDPDSAPLAVSLAKNIGARVIFDIHELYHGALLDRWLFGLQLPAVRSYFKNRIRSVASKCNLVIGVSESVLAPYVTGSTPNMVVRSCAPSWFADGEPADVCGNDRECFRVMHGKSDIQRGALQIVEAAAIVRKDVEDVSFLMFHEFDPVRDGRSGSVVSRIQALEVERFIDLRRGVPMQEMPNILRSCDVGLIAYGRDLGVDSLPNRLFEYMALGIAVVAPSYATEIAKIIEAEGCGILVDFEEPLEIAKAILHLRRNPDVCRAMGRRGRSAFLQRHNWEVEVRPVIEAIENWRG